MLYYIIWYYIMLYLFEREMLTLCLPKVQSINLTFQFNDRWMKTLCNISRVDLRERVRVVYVCVFSAKFPRIGWQVLGITLSLHAE